MTRPFRVAVLTFSPVPLFEMSVACEVYGVDRTGQGVPPSTVRLCSDEPGPLRTNVAGLEVSTPHGLSSLRWADQICVVGWPFDRFDQPVPDDVIAALRRAHRRGVRIISFCSGAFVLAAAGLLTGFKPTLHWMHVETFRRVHPELDVDAGALYAGDGQVFTAAGTSSAIDLCLHLARIDHGATVANSIARRMVVPPHRDGGQLQYVDTPLAVAPSSGQMSSTLDWAICHLAEDLSIEAMARHTAMSPRTFARRFKEATGTTPLRWLLVQRVLLAQRLLETTALPIEHIADQCGFGTAATMRMHFSRLVGPSPQAYRSTFSRLAS